MSNETKRDVFKDMKWELISNLANTIDQNGGLHPVEDVTKIADNYATRYAAALPDDLPVIPKEVSDYIRKTTAPGKNGLIEVFCSLADDIRTVGHDNIYKWELWMLNNQAAVARAWALGIWRVEEKGEIVKLEAEK